MTLIRFHAEFESDLDAIWLRIARDNVRAADRFVEGVRSTCSEIARHPQIGWERGWQQRRLAGVRSWRVDRFVNYLIFYRLEGEDTIAFIAVLHGSRSLPRILRRRTS